MGRKKIDRANQREENNESLETEHSLESDHSERVMRGGARGDANAGDEGLDDPAMSRAHRDDMSATRMQGDKLSRSPERMTEQSEESEQRKASQRSQRTEERANDERFDNAEDFGGQGSQKEGSDRNAEGTGYTE
jgi:hypothetical protein